MPTAKSRKFLEALLSSAGPSGFEEETAKIFREYLNGFSDRVYTDVTGNTIGILNEKAQLRIMLAGHYDEIGFQIVHISEEGLLYFRRVGGIDNITVPGTEVDVLTEKDKIPGIIGKKPIHLSSETDRNKVLDLHELWIDIGAENKKDAEKLVTIGDPAVVKKNFEILGKNRVKSKGMDDRIGAFIVAETLRELSKRKLNVAVYGVGTVQEEIGLRGATTSAFGVNPHVGIAIDVGFASDTPSTDKKICGDTSLGKGPILVRNADNNKVLGKLLRKAGDKNKIKYQNSADYKASGGTDTAAIQLTRSGVATALISIPTRYIHTPVEMCDLRDVDGAVQLLTETIAGLSGKETFIPGMESC